MKVERIDDLPLLAASLTELKIRELIDAHFPTHGNREGISLGTLGVVFLLYVLSESDHRLSHIEEWSAEREQTLRHLLGCPTFTSKDCTDDRLASFLDYFSQDAAYNEFETALNQHVLSVYSLDPEPDDLSANAVHLDASIAQSFKDTSDFFSIGYAKHRRPDLVQVKFMLATYGTFGLPLCVEVVNGATADDVLYLPMIERVKHTLARVGLLFVGDAKLGSLANRAAIQKAENYYLTPLSRVQLPLKNLKELLVEHKDNPDTATTVTINDHAIKAFDVPVPRMHDNYEWNERLVLAFSPDYHTTQVAAFEKHLCETTTILGDLMLVKQGKTPIKTQDELETKIQEVLKAHKTADFFDISITATVTKVKFRKYGDKPARTEDKTAFTLQITEKTAEIAAHKAVLGWRAYVTNAPAAKLSVEKVIATYKAEFNVEYRFNQLHNKTAPLMPIFLHKDNRIVALIRFLTLGIKVLGIMEYNIRKKIADEKITVSHIYPGNPSRKTDKPTIEMILRALRNISLVIITLNDTPVHVHVSTLSKHQQLFIRLAGFNDDIYTNITQFLKSTA